MNMKINMEILRVGRVVGEHGQPAVIDHLFVTNQPDEFGKINIEPARGRSVENQHFADVRNKQQQTIVEEKCDEIDADRARSKASTKENDDTDQIADETTDEDRC